MLRYRTEAEYECWRQRCPIASFTRRLVDSGVIDQEEIGRIATEIMHETDEAVAFAKSIPFRDP